VRLTRHGMARLGFGRAFVILGQPAAETGDAVMENNVVPMIPRPTREWIEAFEAFCEAFNTMSWKKEPSGRMSLSVDDVSKLTQLSFDAGIGGPPR
jgi:hypothetical protein